MKVLIILIGAILAANAKYTLDYNNMILVCRANGTQNCNAWLMDDIGIDATMDVIRDNLRAYNLCGYTNDLDADPIQMMSLRNRPREITCKNLNLKEDTSTDFLGPDDYQREKEIEMRERAKRAVSIYPKGGYRGQSQSQYLHFAKEAEEDNKSDDGKAEAHSTVDGSRAIVSEFPYI